MKNITVTTCLYFCLSLLNLFAQPSYLMNLSNASRPDINTFEFDVDIKSTNANFVLTAYQCSFTYNVGNSNGGNLSFTYISNTSELSNVPSYMVGVNNTNGNSKLTFASSAGIDTIKSATMRVGRFRLQNTTLFTNPLFNITWNFTDLVNTIISSTGFMNITNPEFHTNLSFIADTTAPKVLTVSLINNTNIDVNFSEALNPASAKILANYFINNGITINSVTLSPDGTRVSLNTSQHSAGNLYTLIVSNVKDTSGNLISRYANSSKYSFENPKLNVTIYPLTSADDGYIYISSTGTFRNSLYSTMGNIGGYRNALIRFPNAGCVAGKIIDSAFVYITAYGNSNYSGVNIRISANDTANAQPISAYRSVELGKALTTAKVDWNDIPVWRDGAVYKSPDVSTVIQEWADITEHRDTSDALLLFFNNNSSSTNGRRVFSQWDYSQKKGMQGQEKPNLIIYYHDSFEIPIIDSIYSKSITQNSVTLNAGINTGNQSTNVKFHWGIDSSTYSKSQEANNSPLTSNGEATLNVSGLSPNTKYYFRASVTNSNGSDTSYVRSFTTLPNQTTITDTFFMNSAADDISYYNGSANGNVSRFGETSNYYRGIEHIYKNISIPQNAEIVSAVIQVKAIVSSSGTVIADVYTDLRDNPLSVLPYNQYNVNTNFSSLSIQYSAPAYTAGNFYSINITSIIQDKFNQAGWTNGDNLGIIIKGNTNLSSNVFREIVRAENSLADNKLIITYKVGLSKITANGENEITPDNYELYQNYPNPFNPVTTIQYQILQDGLVTLKVYDMLGKEVGTLIDEQKSIGKYSVSFDASDLASGVYIYQVRVNDFVSTKKMMLIK